MVRTALAAVCCLKKDHGTQGDRYSTMMRPRYANRYVLSMIYIIQLADQLDVMTTVFDYSHTVLGLSDRAAS